MRLSRSFLRPLRSGGGAAIAYFFRRRRRLRSTGSSRRSTASPFFTSIGRKRGGAAENHPEPSSPKVTCIGQVRVKSQKKVKQCRRRINGEASFRSAAEPSFQQQQRRWVHLPSFSSVLRALGRQFCCFFRCCDCKCSCSCFPRRQRGCGRWCARGRRREIDEEEEEEEEPPEEIEVMLDTNSRRHVFDDIEVNGDLIELKGRSFFHGEEGFAISIPPKNALLLMRCRSDPIKMAAIANRISSDAVRYVNFADNHDDDTTSSDEVFEARVLEQEARQMFNQDKSFVCNDQKVDEIEQEFNEDEEEEVESNMSSFEALLETENYQDCQIKEVEVKSEENVDNRDPAAVEEDDKQEKEAPAPAALPENQEKEVPAPAALPECLLLMMREPKLSMEVSKETWVCATDFIRLHPERPRRVAAKAAGDQEAAVVVKRRAAAEKSKPRVPPPAPKKNEAQPARSSCSLPAAAGSDRKRGGACEPIELTRCKSEPMSTAAAKLMPEPGCWKENVEMEPHRQASLGVGAAPAGVGC